MKGQSAAKLLNDKYGVFTIISERQIINNRGYYNCKCSRCNNITSIRSDRLNNSPKACKHCINSLLKEISDTKYLKLRKYKRIYHSYRSNALNRNLLFELTLENVIKLIDDKCFYCHDKNSKGIDRIDNSKNYNLNNVISCCKQCNFMKNDSTKEEFLNKIKEIYNIHLKESSTTIPEGSTLK